MNESKHVVGQSFDAIQEEDETKAMKIFQEFRKSGKIDPRDFINLTNLQIINKFMSKHENAMTVKKFVLHFKNDHTQRYIAMTMAKAKPVVAEDRKYGKGKSVLDMLPGNRKVKTIS